MQNNTGVEEQISCNVLLKNKRANKRQEQQQSYFCLRNLLLHFYSLLQFLNYGQLLGSPFHRIHPTVLSPNYCLTTVLPPMLLYKLLSLINKRFFVSLLKQWISEFGYKPFELYHLYYYVSDINSQYFDYPCAQLHVFLYLLTLCCLYGNQLSAW